MGRAKSIALDFDVGAVWKQTLTQRLGLARVLINEVARNLRNGHTPSQNDIVYPLRIAGALSECNEDIVADVEDLATVYNERVMRSKCRDRGRLLEEIRFYGPEQDVVGRVVRCGREFEYHAP